VQLAKNAYEHLLVVMTSGVTKR